MPTNNSQQSAFTFFQALPVDMQHTIMDYQTLNELAYTVKISKAVNTMIKNAREDYLALIEGQKIVEQQFSECDLMYVPNWPENSEIEDHLLYQITYKSKRAYVLVEGHRFKLFVNPPTESQIQDLTSLDICIYFDNDICKFVVKRGTEVIHDEFNSDIAALHPIAIKFIDSRQKDILETLKVGVQKLAAGENFPISMNTFAGLFHHFKIKSNFVLKKIQLFYVDILFQRVTSCQPSKEFFELFRSALGASNGPKQLNNEELNKLQVIEKSDCTRQSHVNLKKLLSTPLSMMALGKNNGPNKTKGLFNIHDLIHLPDPRWIPLILSPTGIHAITEGIINIKVLPNLIGTCLGLYNNLSFLLSKGFYILNDKYADFETAVELKDLEEIFTAEVLQAIDCNLITADDIRQLSITCPNLKYILSSNNLGKLCSSKNTLQSLIREQRIILESCLPIYIEITHHIEQYLTRLERLRNEMKYVPENGKNLVDTIIRDLKRDVTNLSNGRIDPFSLAYKIRVAFKILRHIPDWILVRENIFTCSRCKGLDFIPVIRTINHDFVNDQHLLNQLTAIFRNLNQLGKNFIKTLEPEVEPNINFRL